MKTSAGYMETLEKLYNTLSLGARNGQALSIISNIIML